LDRRHALWAVKGLSNIEHLPLFQHTHKPLFQKEPDVKLPAIQLGEQVVDDYRSLKLSLKAHPMELLRPYFNKKEYTDCRKLTELPNDSIVLLAGLVLIRQRPGSARGVLFITIEDETGVANLIVWPQKMELYRRTVFGSQLLGVQGKLQREGIVTHIVAERLFDHSSRLCSLSSENYSNSKRTKNSNLPTSQTNDHIRTRINIPRSRDFK